MNIDVIDIRKTFTSYHLSDSGFKQNQEGTIINGSRQNVTKYIYKYIARITNPPLKYLPFLEKIFCSQKYRKISNFFIFFLHSIQMRFQTIRSGKKKKEFNLPAVQIDEERRDFFSCEFSYSSPSQIHPR